jgi:60 kDa SS-A/Ro ribonucleoprotein
MGFSSGFIPLDVFKGTKLKDAVEKTSRLPFDSTDCALPIMWALANKAKVDAFVVYTDNETFAVKIHPTQALDKYRQYSGVDAKLIVCGMTATSFTIADPRDTRQLDVVGFSTDTPQVISSFVRS